MADNYTNNQSGFTGNILHGVRQQIEDQMGQAIDHYAGHVPGGEQFTPEAKKALSGVLDGLQKQLEDQAASRLGGIGGGSGLPSTTSPGNQNNNGSLL